MIRTANGTPVFVRGEGLVTLILIHGVLVDHRMWHRQVAALSAHVRVCCIDMLGHGDALDPPGERTLDDFVTQAHEVVEQFSDQGKPVLGGFSMGGLITQAFAARYHELLSGIIILNAVHDRSPEQTRTVWERFKGNRDKGVENAVESGRTRWFTERDHVDDPDVIRDVELWMRSGDFTAKRKAHRVFVTSDAEVTGKLGAITCPALVMTGERDAGSTPEMAAKMAAAIPDSELHVLDDQHHMMPVLDAGRVNPIIARFLACLQKA